MSVEIEVDVYIGNLVTEEQFWTGVPEYMSECAEEVRTHHVENVRWDSDRTVESIPGFSGLRYSALVAEIVSTKEHGGSECCGGATVLYSVGESLYAKEISYGH